MKAAPDPEFVAYVRARQHRQLQSAYLVTLHEPAAERAVVHGYSWLATRWQMAREEHPEPDVRRQIYRAALAEATPRDAVPAALAGLSAPARAALVAALFDGQSRDEVCRLSGLTASEAEQVLAGAGARLHAADPVSVPTESRDAIAAALRLWSAAVPERDCAQRAWLAVRARRARWRRGVVAVVAAGAVVAGTAFGLSSITGQDTAVSSPTAVVSGAPDVPQPSPTRTRDRTRGPSLARDGTPFDLAPLSGTEIADPVLGLPGVVAVSRAREPLTPTDRPARLVALKPISRGIYSPVVYLDDRTAFVVDGLELVDDPGADDPPILSPGAVSPDGHRIAFLQSRKVVILDLRSADAVSVPVPDDPLTEIQWLADGESAIARGVRAWRIDPASTTVVQLDPLASGMSERVDADGESPPQLVTTSGNGRDVDTRPFRGPVSATYGTTATTAGVRSAAAVFLSSSWSRGSLGDDYFDPNDGFEALVAWQPGSDRATRMLVFVDDPDAGLFLQCCPVLGTTAQGEVVYVSRSRSATTIMTWSPTTGLVRQQAFVVGSGPVALGPLD